MSRAVWLDGLRGIAAAIVATDHYFMGAVLHAGFRSFWADPPEENRKLMQLPPLRLIFAAHAMVPLFFVVSGYAISINLIRLRTARNSEGFLRRLASAATRRGLRIYLPVFCITVISQILFFLNLFSWVPGDDIAWGRKPWVAPWFHVTFVGRYMLDNINIIAIQYNGGLNGQLWTMALEFRGSCVVYLALLGLAFWQLRPRLWLLVASMAYWFYFGYWDVVGFLAGYWLAEQQVLSELQTVSTEAEYLAWLKPYIPVQARSVNFSTVQTWVMFVVGIWFLCLSDDGALPPGYQFLQIAESSRWDGNWGTIDKSWKTVGSVIHPNQQKLIDRAREFLAEVEDLTPGKDLEATLNRDYGPGNPYYDDFCRLIREALENDEGWVAVDEIDGPKYRRTRISPPSELNRHFSITTVYMDSQEEYRGQYHLHPYGELNCVVQLDSSAELMGMSGWQGSGWTSPGPGTHHYPEVRGGALVALFFLPAGRISYKRAKPGDPQPIAI
ncbi:hypothetical protein TsFJ059_009301 [Trichoderma semiorbis]|uniref:Acyltransferase 3 domain-containing protein n=1 Tax=Trichoderma semiorbis TaxID=1491008 RepID=A0A9P8HIH1_9HYPO|nr:hypothetical protein TsFJ059_009301 [Trichoderma semiorbis]